MKLFGLIEIVTIRHIFNYTVQIPHPELLKRLEQFGKDVSVGLENISPENPKEFGKVKFISPEVYHDITHFFVRRGNKMHSLGSLEEDKKAADIGNQFADLSDRLQEAKSQAEYESLVRQLDKLEIEFNYLTKVAKEDGIFERIGQKKPDLVILGAAHSSELYRRQDWLKDKYGITIDEYWEDEITKETSEDDLMFAMGASSEHMPTERYLEGSTQVRLRKVESVEEATNPMESLLISRLYKALKEGRVTDNNPDFIGTWDPKIEHRGLFEVFVKTREGTFIDGTIEDVNGPGTFTGKMEGDVLVFDKKYTPPLGPTAAKGRMTYRARLKDGKWEGTYEGGDCAGRFWMKSRSA